MLEQVAEGVLVHESAFVQSNAVVVVGESGALLVDPGVQDDEMACLAKDLGDAGLTVTAGFSTHPHWDHLLWHPLLGDVPRYATAVCASTIRARMADPGFMTMVAAMIPPEFVEQVPLELLGQVTGLPAGTTHLPWDGPAVRIIEHRAHAAGHASLLVEGRRVLVAGDMLSDVLVPMLDLRSSAAPVDEYLAALRLLEDVADDVDVVIPGHGSVGGAGEARARVGQDHAYVAALREGQEPRDPRIGPSAKDGWSWVADVHAGQVRQLAQRE